MGKKCKFNFCTKAVAARGWCYGHYRRWLKYGDPGYSKIQTFDNPRICTITGCTKKYRCLGLCNTHYNRRISYGDPNIKVNIKRDLMGLSGTPTHISYRAMLERCSNKNSKHYGDYGGRGIRVCERWLNSFNDFVDDMGLRPDGTTIDRIDPNGNYEPANCRWANKFDQSNNKRRTIYIDYKGARIPLKVFSDMLNIPYGTVKSRLARGWSIEKIVNTPIT